MFERARERSTVCRLVTRGRKRVRTAIERSALARLLGVGDRSRDSTETRPASFPTRPLGSGFARSRTRTVLSPFTNAAGRIRRTASDSRLAGFGTRCKRYAESSVGYRWLTAEPEPDVIVIDLRETRTVGPVVRAVDRTIRELAAGTPTSTVTDIGATLASFGRDRPLRAASAFGVPVVLGSLLAVAFAGALSEALLAIHVLLAALAALGLRSTRSLEELLETRGARALTAAFEPPEPPTTAESTEANSGTGTDTVPESADRSTDEESSDGC